jgi:sugar O-acyltransferase (sialic acid O-acetyltransferase NeuD family)
MSVIDQKEVAIIGYSGHGLVVIDIFQCAGRKVSAYCDTEEKQWNPYNLKYLGSESNGEVKEKLRKYDYFMAIGHNGIRKKIYLALYDLLGDPPNAIHPSATISGAAKLKRGVMVAANASINPFAEIGTGVICNTGSVIEHECRIGDFVHIAPGAVLNGNVTVGDGSFVGANSVVRQGVVIGKNVTIGAGAVVLENIEDGLTVVGNPQRTLK